jgi:glyoxylase-like metal-dependent hydrolase (beta-lactamase superfamily II)
MEIGKYRVDIIRDNVLLLDGGVVFSGLEKEEWSPLVAPVQDNKIYVGINFLLVRGRDANLIIDTGIGAKLGPGRAKALGLKPAVAMDEHLAPFGLKTEDITHVIFSHLHFDHCGGATQMEGDAVVPVFKNALHIVQKEEWAAAVAPNEINKRAYFYKDFLPLQHGVNLKLVKGNLEIVENIFLEVTGGHTKGHQILRIEEDRDSFAYLADLCPTEFHLCVDRREAFDLYPLDVVEAKKRFLRAAAKNNATIAFSHELKGSFYKIEEANNCYNCTEYEAQ